jgi:iron complex outermembrane receptor protein
MTHSYPLKFKRTPLAFFIGLSLTLGTSVVSAQEQAIPAAEENSVERIMVTASKRLKGLQETPIAVTVTSGEAIEQAAVRDMGDLQVLVPTLRVTPLQRSTNAGFAIRGFGNGTNNTGIEPSVGVFIDGVYRSRAASQIGDLPRVQQIEVLSGPQSTLFGKNASAGVISVRTLAPSYDFEGKIEAGLGNYNQRLMKGYATGGVSDTLALSLSGGFNKRDGYTESISGLSALNNRDRWNIRGQALYEPSDDVTFRFIADYSEIEEQCCTVANVINGPTAAAVQALGGQVLDDADPFSYQSALNVDPNDKIEDGGVSMQIDVDFDDYAFTSISAYRNNESSYINDIDFTSLDILQETANTKIDTFTQEFRLASTGERTLDWMVGAFIFQEEVDFGDTLFFGTNTRNYFNALGLTELLAGVEGVYGLSPRTFFSADTIVNSNYTQDNDAYSVFLSFDYHISNALTATAGVSYTKDEKQVTVNQVNTDRLSAIDLDNDLTLFGVAMPLIPSLSPFIPTLKGVQFLPNMLEFPNSVEDGKSDDSKTTWSVRIAYELNRNINFFATAATGFKATSWNLSRDGRPFPSDTAALTSAGLIQKNQNYGTRFAGPEEATVYELGMKSSFKQGGINVTIFDQTIDGFQSSIFVGTGFVLANAGQQSTQGIEFDAVYRPTDNISLTFAGTLLDPVYDSFVGASGLTGPVDLSGKKPAGIHEQSLVAGITYNFELDNDIYGYARADYIYESEVHLVENVPETMTREVSTINLSTGLTFSNGVSAQLWVRNLTNDEYFLSAFPTPIQSGSFNAYPSQPRTFGINVAYEF